MAERGRPSFRRLHSWNLDEPWSDLAAPSRLWDQFFGMGLADDDFFYAIPRSSLRARPALPMPVTPDEEDRFKSLFLRPRRSESSAPGHGMSEVSNTGDEFRVNLDVAHFSPEEIHVKTVDNKVVIHAKHEEKEDEHGYIMREFRRSYLLPKDVDPTTVKSTLSADGVLSIKGPKKTAPSERQERAIPIEHTSAAIEPQ